MPPTVCRLLIRRLFSNVFNCFAVAPEVSGVPSDVAVAAASFFLALISCFSFLVSELFLCKESGSFGFSNPRLRFKSGLRFGTVGFSPTEKRKSLTALREEDED